uniref:Uncharacterized protein n=1 Tax=Oryza nivara TaxID=4536 RepID=A0A0E0HL76_ORYNI
MSYGGLAKKRKIQRAGESMSRREGWEAELLILTRSPFQIRPKIVETQHQKLPTPQGKSGPA